MAKYYTDFRDEWIGPGVPSGWTQRITSNGNFSKVRDSSNPGGKSFRITSTLNGSLAASYNAVDGVADVESLVKFRVNGSEDMGRHGILNHRYSGTSDSNTAGYNLSFTPANGVKSLLIVNDQTGATIGFTNYNWSTGTVYWARFRTVGTSLQAKVWPDGSSEPAGWMINTVNSTFPGGSGTYSGVSTYKENPSGVDIMEYAVATEGDTATRELPQPVTFPNGYMYRKKITAKSGYLSTNSFAGPMVVQGVFPELKAVPLGGKVYHPQDYYDILFTNENGVPLNWGMEVYNYGTGSLVAWVHPGSGKMSSSGSEDNRSIYMYYGKPVMGSSTTDMNAVWSGYDFSLLMNGSQGGGRETTYPEGTWFAPENSNWQTASGIHGLARKFSGGGLYKNYESRYDLHRGVTLAMQVRFNSLPASGQVIPLYQIIGQGAFRYDNMSGTRSLNLVKYGVVDQRVNYNLSAGVWYHLTCVVDTSQTRYYVNGNYIGAFDNSSDFKPRTAGKQPTIMWPDSTAQSRLNVDIDTMNMVSKARPAWAITVEYNNQSKSDFWEIGAEEISALVIESSGHELSSDDITLIENSTLALDNALNGHLSEVVALIYHDTISTPNASSHSLTSQISALIRNISLAINSSTHSLTSDQVTVSFGHLLEMIDSIHTLSSTQVKLSQAQLIAIANTLHTLAGGNPIITENKTLKNIGNTLHATKSDMVKLLENYILAIENLIHGHESEQVVLLQSDLLSVNTALHGLQSNIVDILEYTLLGEPHSAKHSIVSVNVELVQKHILAIEDAINALKSDEGRVVNWDRLGVGFGNYRPTLDKNGDLISVELDSVGIYLGNLAKTGELKAVEIDYDGLLKPVRPEQGKYN